ncbi:hypothetical protein [uncultured Gilvimarinus sp.]|uniref:hypothetical protein n=1 Tax=uncultured Gilvimarinus sp. TaxID=1689143 RepID=UPI0030DCF658
MFNQRCFRRMAFAAALIVSGYSQVHAQTTPEAPERSPKTESPWLLVPKVSSNPKIGSSVGFLGGYLFKLDPTSTSSMVGASGSYSDTDSVTANLFLRSFWDSDRKRVIAAVSNGKIRNDYEDYLGSGQQVATTDNMKLAFARYLQNIHSHWFLGAQAIYTNYFIDTDNVMAGDILSLLGLSGYTSGALGLVTTFDSRDNQNSPSSGISFNANNFAYRENLGGEEDFDVYRVTFQQYLSVHKKGLLAYRAQGRWTDDAPASAYSSIGLRGYTRGQYLAPNSILLEGEYRWHLKGRFGINVFAGVTCLYGDKKSCDDSENIYTSAGIGGQYLIKPAEKMVISFDIAKGEGDNHGLYLRFGHSF